MSSTKWTEHGHIGDGVYVSDDGFQMWLAANDHNNKVIALEPEVFKELLRAAAKVWGPEAVAGILSIVDIELTGK